MSSLSRESHLAYACTTAGISLLLSTAAWAETIHLNVPTVRVKPVAVRVKPTVHLPVSAGLGKQHLSKGSTAPGRWHDPGKGDNANGNSAPASPGAAAYSVTVGKPPIGATAGERGATQGGMANSATDAGGGRPTTGPVGDQIPTLGAPAGGTYPGIASSTIPAAVSVGPPYVILDPVSSGVGSTLPALPVVMLWSVNIDVGVIGRLVAAETVFPGLPFVIIASAAVPY